MGVNRVSISRFMSILRRIAKEHSSFHLWLIPLEFQNKIFKLDILGCEYGQEGLNCRCD